MPDKKYKGTGRYGPRQGLGRLRRAADKGEGRLGNWERHAEDDHFLEQHGERERGSHIGESLLASFNRAARDAAMAPEGTEPGEVCGFSGRLVLVRMAGGGELPCEIRQALKRRIAGVKNPLCVGDRVRVTRADDGSGSIEAVAPRANQLVRADSHNKALLHVLAANVERLVIVSSLGDPPFKPAFIDRYLVIAATNDVPPLVVVNKNDLGDAAPALALYGALGIETLAACAQRADDPGVAALRERLRGRTAMFAGQSGVGKSSLINALYPEVAARVGTVNSASGLGRHTTTAARSHPLPGGGALIDTPGIRECGITGLDPIDVALLYPDLARFHHACRFNDCSHRHEPDCAVRAAVERGEIARTRYDSYRAIVDEDLAS